MFGIFIKPQKLSYQHSRTSNIIHEDCCNRGIIDKPIEIKSNYRDSQISIEFKIIFKFNKTINRIIDRRDERYFNYKY